MSEIKPIRIPSGVANRERTIGFFTAQNDLLECVDLADGRLLARSDVPMYPLVADRRRVLVWTSSDDLANFVVFCLVEQRKRSLETVWRTPIELPDWVVATKQVGSPFSLAAKQVGDDFAISWEAKRGHVGGMHPSDEWLERVSRDAAGKVLIRAENGLLIESMPKQIHKEDPAIDDPISNLPLVPYLRGGRTFNQPWGLGEMNALILNDETQGGLCLRHLDSSHKQTIDEHFLVTQTELCPVVSFDGEYLFIYKAGINRWTVFSARSADEIATLKIDRGVEEIAVLNSHHQRLIYAIDAKQSNSESTGRSIQRTVNSCDLKTGEHIWSRVLFEKTLPMDRRTFPGMHRGC